MSNSNYSSLSAAIYGCAGEELSADEKAFFADTQPYGFILFARNCNTPDQIKALIAEFHDVTQRDVLPILIDQEGGRVARLTPPHWRLSPPAGLFAELACTSLEKAAEATYLNARLIAQELHALGITVNCAPLLDLPVKGAHDIIGDRAFGSDALTVVTLAEAQIRGFMEGGVLPIIKHIPGHGRANADSHKKLPVVDEPLAELQRTDFLPFKALNSAPYAMTAHILYTDIDADLVATMSPTVIDLIRNDIGFQGLLMTDDLSMHALTGTFEERAQQSLAAGCDLLLHCNGDFEEMQAVAKGAQLLTARSAQLAKSIASAVPTSVPALDVKEMETQLASLVPAISYS